MSYEIGYRRPPRSSQFKKGVSGNPKGRPKGSKNFATLLEKELLAPVVVTENGRKRSLTRLQALAKKIVSAALQEGPKSQLALVDVMRRTGLLDVGVAEDSASLLPDNYREILDAFVRTTASARATTRVITKEKSHGNK